MLGYFKKIKDKKRRKTLYIEFYVELEKNLENYYVCFQLNDFRPFGTEKWHFIQDDPEFQASEKVLKYIEKVKQYNALLDEFKQYENWYGESPDNKTRESASILHDKKEKVSERFKANLEGTIKEALSAYEEQLRELKILKSQK